MKKSNKYPVVLLIALIQMFNYSCHTGENRQSDIEGENITDPAGLTEIMVTRKQFESSGMKIGNPVERTFIKMVSANGYIVASPSGHAKISALIPGKIKQLYHSTGDYINKGQLLFTIESSEIIQLQQEYAESFNKMNSVKETYERQKILSEDNITPMKDFINAESEYRSLLSKTEGLKARLLMINIAPSDVEKGMITRLAPVYSPVEGYITEHNIVLGQFIESGEKAMEIINTGLFQLNIQVFENDLKNMKVGQKVLYYDPDDADRIYEATLSHVGKSINKETKTVLCIAQIKPEESGEFVNNLFVETQVITSRHEGLSIPAEALISEDGLNYVLVLNKEEEDIFSFRKTPVNTGPVYDNWIEVIDEGLKNILFVGAYDVYLEQ